MNWLKRFMYGRYGFDAFSNFLLILSLILYFIVAFIPFKIFIIIPLGLIFYTYYRCFSRNIQKRFNENLKFKSFFRPLTSFFSIRRKKFKDRKTHKYFKCPQCKQYMRVPKNKGKIQMTCPKCKQVIIAKTWFFILAIYSMSLAPRYRPGQFFSLFEMQ